MNKRKMSKAKKTTSKGAEMFRFVDFTSQLWLEGRRNRDAIRTCCLASNITIFYEFRTHYFIFKYGIFAIKNSQRTALSKAIFNNANSFYKKKHMWMCQNWRTGRERHFSFIAFIFYVIRTIYLDVLIWKTASK